MTALARRNQELVKAKRIGVNWKDLAPPLIATGVFGGFTVGALALSWGLGWAIAGLVLTAFSVVMMIGSASDQPMPTGAIPVRVDVELSSGGDEVVPVRVIAVVRIATKGTAAENAHDLYAGRTIVDVGEAATALIEGLVRGSFNGAPLAELERATIADVASVPASWSNALTRMALVLESLWIGPA